MGEVNLCQRSEGMAAIGAVAQMVERMLSMHEAQGSIPRWSTSDFSSVVKRVKVKVKVAGVRGEGHS